MAISTYNTFLMHGTTSSGSTTYSKLCDIKEFPDTGSSPETLETTTMTNAMKTFIVGLQGNDAFEFKANYDPTVYGQLVALSGSSEKYALYFGSDDDINVTDANPSEGGDMGKFTFTGQLSVWVNGASVNEVVEMTIGITPNSTISFSAS